MKKLLLLLFLLPNLVMAEDSKWKRKVTPVEKPSNNTEQEIGPSVSRELQSKPLKNKKTLTIYACEDTDSLEKGFWNAKECNQNCKKTKRLLQFKVNQQYNKVLLIYTRDDGSTYEEVLESNGISYTDAGITRRIYKVLEIFDEDHWEYIAGSPGRYKRTKSFKNGKWANYMWDSSNEPIKHDAILIGQACGK